MRRLDQPAPRRVGRLSAAAILALLWTAPGQAQDAIPDCAAPNVLSDIELQYQFGAGMPVTRGTLKIDRVKDLGVFAPPKNANQYSNEQMYIKAVRYCEAIVTLADGQEDPTFWQILQTFNHGKWFNQSAFCSLKHDVWQNQCAVYKPEAP